jgi:hypothetical protein
MFLLSSSSASFRTERGVAPRADLAPDIVLSGRFAIGVLSLSSSRRSASRAICARRIQGAGTCGPNAPAFKGFDSTWTSRASSSSSSSGTVGVSREQGTDSRAGHAACSLQGPKSREQRAEIREQRSERVALQRTHRVQERLIGHLCASVELRQLAAQVREFLIP